MSTIQVENLTFVFETGIDACKYDDSDHYRNVWVTAQGGQKAVDVVAVETAANPGVGWLIEAKDFRIVSPATPPRPSNVAGLPQTMASKVADTISGLADAASNAVDPNEKQFASQAVATPTKRVVLHIEPHNGPHSALFPVGFPASVLQVLRPLVRNVDPNPLVLSIATTPSAGVPWTVS